MNGSVHTAATSKELRLNLRARVQYGLGLRLVALCVLYCTVQRMKTIVVSYDVHTHVVLQQQKQIMETFPIFCVTWPVWMRGYGGLVLRPLSAVLYA